MIRSTVSAAARKLACLLLAAGLVAATTPVLAQGTGSATLDAIRARGQLLCGVSGGVAGFSLPDSQGVMRGLDADSCRAVAAAALGDFKSWWAPTSRTRAETPKAVTVTHHSAIEK